MRAKTQSAQRRPSVHMRTRPYRAHVCVDLEFLAKNATSEVALELPMTFEAADAAIWAALSSMAWATNGNENAVAVVKRYLAGLPADFDKLVRDPLSVSVNLTPRKRTVI